MNLEQNERIILAAGLGMLLVKAPTYLEDEIKELIRRLVRRNEFNNG